MWIIRLLFGEMLTNFLVEIYFKILKTRVHMQILTLALICPDNIYAYYDDNAHSMLMLTNHHDDRRHRRARCGGTMI